MGYRYSKVLYGGSNIGPGPNLVYIYNALVAAGWNINRWTPGSRINANYGSEHIEISTYDTFKARAYYCTGYDSGAAVGSQPGSSPAVYFTWSLHTVGSYLTTQIQDSQILLTGMGSNTNMGNTLFYGVISQKIGLWNGGRILVGDNNSSSSVLGPSIPNGCLFLEGSWVTGLYGTHANAGLLYSRPLSHTGATVLTPIMVCKNNTTDASLRHPIGYVSNLYQAQPTLFYEDGETILIGEVPYRWILANSSYWYLAKAA